MLVEAGRNISADDIPDAVRSRYPGRAYLDTRNIWPRLSALMGYGSGAAAARTRAATSRRGCSAVALPSTR